MFTPDSQFVGSLAGRIQLRAWEQRVIRAKVFVVDEIADTVTDSVYDFFTNREEESVEGFGELHVRVLMECFGIKTDVSELCCHQRLLACTSK